MKYILKYRAVYLLCFFSLLVMWGCADSDIPYKDGSSDSETIKSDDAFVLFVGSTWSNIIFPHQEHADRENNDCFICHDHGASIGDSKWNCGACHKASDPESLCDQDENHGCIMAQCDFCHAQKVGVSPNAPMIDCTGESGDSACCLACHNGGRIASAGVLLDSAVQGVSYQTNTISNKTDADGTFLYKDGEVITFAIADLVLGKTTGGPIRTIVDLVEGAESVTDPTVTNICRLLITLDQDGNPDNGITLTEDIINEVEGRNIDFEQTVDAFSNDPVVQALIESLNAQQLFIANTPRSLCSAMDAQTHLSGTLEEINFPPLVTFPGALQVSGSNGCNAAGCHYQSPSANGTYQIDDTNYADGTLNDKVVYKHATNDYWIHWNTAGDAHEWKLSANTNRSSNNHHYNWGETGGVDDYPPLGGWPSGCATFESQQITAVVSPWGGITGTLGIGEVVTGSYHYFDNEGDTEAGTSIQWYRCDDASGTNDVIIPGAESATYTIVDDDENKYLRFGVTPASSSGNTPGAEVKSGPAGPIIVSEAVMPSGIKVMLSDIAGFNGAYMLDTVNYPEGFFNGKPIYKHETGNCWIHWNTTNQWGSYFWAIGDSPSTDQYQYRATDLGSGNTPPFGWWQKIPSGLGTIPVSANSGINGSYTRTIESGISAPGSTPIGIPGNPWIVGSTLTGTYDFYDEIPDLEQGSTYQWYRCVDETGTSDLLIPGAEFQSYTPTSSDVGYYLKFEVTPGVAGGNTPGIASKSMAVGPITNTMIYTGEISSSSDVDYWSIHLDSISEVIIDVQAFEACGMKPIPSDFFNDGHANNGLNSAFYLFTAVGGEPDTWVATWTEGPGAHSTRSGQNPYLSISNLPAGDYIVAIGSKELTETDAKDGSNSNGGYWSDEYSPNNYYNILVTINP